MTFTKRIDTNMVKFIRDVNNLRSSYLKFHCRPTDELDVHEAAHYIHAKLREEVGPSWRHVSIQKSTGGVKAITLQFGAVANHGELENFARNARNNVDATVKVRLTSTFNDVSAASVIRNVINDCVDPEARDRISIESGNDAFEYILHHIPKQDGAEEPVYEEYIDACAITATSMIEKIKESARTYGVAHSKVLESVEHTIGLLARPIIESQITGLSLLNAKFNVTYYPNYIQIKADLVNGGKLDICMGDVDNITALDDEGLVVRLNDALSYTNPTLEYFHRNVIEPTVDVLEHLTKCTYTSNARRRVDLVDYRFIIYGNNAVIYTTYPTDMPYVLAVELNKEIERKTNWIDVSDYVMSSVAKR